MLMEEKLWESRKEKGTSEGHWGRNMPTSVAPSLTLYTKHPTEEVTTGEQVFYDAMLT